MARVGRGVAPLRKPRPGWCCRLLSFQPPSKDPRAPRWDWGVFPVLWVMGEPWVGAGSCGVPLAGAQGMLQTPHRDGAVGFGAVGCAFIPPPAPSEFPSMELGVQPPPHCRRDGCWPCPHGFSLALTGECGQLRSCEACTASNRSHNGTDCVWVGCGTPEEPGEGLGWGHREGLSSALPSPVTAPRPSLVALALSTSVPAAVTMVKVHLSCLQSPSLGL